MLLEANLHNKILQKTWVIFLIYLKMDYYTQPEQQILF